MGKKPIFFGMVSIKVVRGVKSHLQIYDNGWNCANKTKNWVDVIAWFWEIQQNKHLTCKYVFSHSRSISPSIPLSLCVYWTDDSFCSWYLLYISAHDNGQNIRSMQRHTLSITHTHTYTSGTIHYTYNSRDWLKSFINISEISFQMENWVMNKPSMIISVSCA